MVMEEQEGQYNMDAAEEESTTMPIEIPIHQSESDHSDVPAFPETPPSPPKEPAPIDIAAAEDDDFDDFGDFDQANNDDFDDFADENQSEKEVPMPVMAPVPPPAPASIDISSLSLDDFRNAISSTLEDALPEGPSPDPVFGPISDGPHRILYTPESRAIWNTLLTTDRANETRPINWKRARIRRDFYVALGVPIDLDEILPPETKAKKLILPHVHLTDTKSPSLSRRGSNASITSTRSRREPPPPPDVDLTRAREMCGITHEKLVSSYKLDDLQKFQAEMEAMTNSVSDLLTYWLDMRERQVVDAETYNGMIEQLVGYAQKARGGTAAESDTKSKTPSWNGQAMTKERSRYADDQKTILIHRPLCICQTDSKQCQQAFVIKRYSTKSK